MKWWMCVVLFCATAVLADGDWRDVNTAQGPVRGRKHSSGQLYEFFNVPYATAPTGVDKFKAPLPPPQWTDRFDAFGEDIIICPQNSNIIGTFPDQVVIQEDCLVANIFVPDTTETNLSVVVYVHGGAFIFGYGQFNKATQLIEQEKDFIMITFNYRLGIHGFLCLGTEDIPGNTGMKDQVALLRWVRDNIASFGGNPNDVTLVGSSAGSASVELLMLSKSAEGLFHKVIPESGGSLAAFSIQRDPLEIAKTHATALNALAIVDDINALEQFYKTASMDSLTANMFVDRTDSTFMFSPCVERNTGDGAFLTESPLSILKNGNYKKLPVLYGFAQMEGLFRILFFDIWKNKMNEKFSDFLPADLEFESEKEREEVANKVKTFYFDENPVGNDQVLKYIDFFTDVIYAFPKLWAVKLQVEAGNDQVYLYEYAFADDNSTKIPYTDMTGADHCAQTAAWMDNLGEQNRNESLDTPEYKVMRKVVREMWHNFIKTGKPVPEGSSLPEWRAAQANRSPHMVLDKEVTLGGILLEERIRFWEEIYEKHYREAIPPRSGASNMAPKNLFSLFALYVIFCFTKRILV